VATLLRKAGAKASSALPKPPDVSIWEAARTGDLESLRTQLAEDGTDLNRRDSNGITPLSWTALSGQLKAAELLLAAGARINSSNKDGSSSLHSSAFFGHLDIVELLVKNRINIDAKNDEGETALDLVSSPWTEDLQGIVQFVAGILKIDLDPEEVQNNRPRIAAFLREHRGKASAELE